MTTHRELLIIPSVIVERHGLFVVGVIVEQGHVRKTVIGMSVKHTAARARKVAGGMSHWRMDITD